MQMHIAVIPGDGIGPEIVEQAIAVLCVCLKMAALEKLGV